MQVLVAGEKAQACVAGCVVTKAFRAGTKQVGTGSDGQQCKECMDANVGGSGCVLLAS